MNINLNYISLEEIENWEVSLEALDEVKWELNQAVAMEDEENCKEMFRKYSQELGLESYGLYTPTYSIEDLINKIEIREQAIKSNIDFSQEGITDKIAKWLDIGKVNFEKQKKTADEALEKIKEGLQKMLELDLKPSENGNTKLVGVWLELGGGKLDTNKISSYFKENTNFAMVSILEAVKGVVGNVEQDKRYYQSLKGPEFVREWVEDVKKKVKVGGTIKQVNDLLLNSVDPKSFLAGSIAFYPTMWTDKKATFLSITSNLKDGWLNKLMYAGALVADGFSARAISKKFGYWAGVGAGVGVGFLITFLTKWVASIGVQNEKFVKPVLTKEAKVPTPADIKAWIKFLIDMCNGFDKYYATVSKNYEVVYGNMKADTSKEMNQIFAAAASAAKSEVQNKLMLYVQTIKSIIDYINSLK